MLQIPNHGAGNRSDRGIEPVESRLDHDQRGFQITAIVLVEDGQLTCCQDVARGQGPLPMLDGSVEVSIELGPLRQAAE